MKSLNIFVVFIFFVILFAGFYSLNNAQAAMSSDNYRIWADSVDQTGNETATSDHYNLQDTGGEVGTGALSSDNYQLGAGFRAMTAEPMFSFIITPNGCSLGVLMEDRVNSCSYTITTLTNAASGYTTVIYSNGDLIDPIGHTIDAVSDGAVTAGSEEYGYRTSGTDGQSNGSDSALTTTPTTVAESAVGQGMDHQVVVTHRASIGTTTWVGAYSQTVTLISTGTF